MKASEKVRHDVLKAMDDAMKAYADRDMEKALSCYAKDNDFVSIGTGKDEIMRGPEEMKKALQEVYEQTEKFSFKSKVFEVSACGDVAWVSGAGIYDIVAEGEKIKMEGRFTVIFERRDGKWLMVHSHYSLPAEQDDGSVLPEE